MEDSNANEVVLSNAGKAPEGSSAFKNISSWIGIAGTLVTILLTIYNSYTKASIDQKEEDLKALELNLQSRTADLEKSKADIERYKWVLSLFPDVDGADDKKRNFTVSLMRLVLTPAEAQQLFAGLQTSTNKDLQSVGQTGIRAIETEPIALLIAQMNASTATERKSAVAKLVREYKSSSQAITLTLALYAP